MKIKSVTADWLHVPIPEDQQHVTDFGRISSFDSILARVETECGIVGYGEARPAAGSAGAGIALKMLIEQELGPLIIGKDPRQISLLWDIMYNGSRAHFAVDRGHVFPILGRRGITICGISGIDIALWDILGKSLGVPVHQLLAGKRRDRMPAYASGGWAPADRIADELQRFLDIGGFKAVKMRVGSADGDVATSVARVQRRAQGTGRQDRHHVRRARHLCAWPRRSASAIGARIAEIAWFEEPVTADDKRGLAEMRAATDIPISTGESEFTRFDFRDLVVHRAADILQPDLSIAGGITEGDAHRGAVRRAWQLRFAAHIWGGATTFAAGLHVSAAASTAFILEYSCGANPLLHGLAEEEFKAVDGMIEIPDRPGLGVTIDEDFVRKYRVQA